MNKKLKIATAAVAVVMAGTMAFGMFGCSNNGGGKKSDKQEKYTVGTGSISDVTLNLDIGDNTQRSVSFKYGELISGTVKLPDGKDYSSSSLKPAWSAFQTMVGCNFNDVFSVTSKKLDTAITATATGSTLADRDIITDSAANVTKNSKKLLDLSNYLDEMPNYKAFLESNDIVRLSLTSDTKTGAMYYAPYFDGNNDLEKYELFKINWVQSLLDATAGDATQTWKASMEAKSKTATATSITSYMGQTGKYHTDVLDKDGKKLAAGIDVNYDKALAAAKGTTGLGAAITETGVAAYNGTSGNIVDIMNYVINGKQGVVTGAQLLKIMQEYIKVAYYVGGTETPFYTQSGYNLSDVFVGNASAWDVDLYAALGRVLVTNPSLVKSGKKGNTIGGEGATELKNVYLLSARQNNMQRMIDSISMVGQLYGVRGLESKNIYSYINSNGELKDPRGEKDVYEAMVSFNGFYNEGLVVNGGSGKAGDQSYHGTSDQSVIEALSTYDYVNTQTPAGFELDGKVTAGKYDIEKGYNYAPIITPVSKWDEDDSDAIEADEYFRFTESWRTTKDTGFCVPVDNVKNNPAKLQAVLKFIDTMFSNDGQIVLTYGPKSTSATANDGFWYNEEATAAQIAAGQYFEFGGKKLYSTVNYSGKYQPHIEENVYTAYYAGTTTQGVKFDASGVTYAGKNLGKDILADDKKVAKDAAVEGDVYVVNNKGEYSKLTGKYKANGWVVTADIAENTAAPKNAKYYVDKNGQVLGKDGKALPLIKDNVNQWTTNATLNYTNFARYVIGSALAIGNKLQSFEFQLTSSMGRAGALVVDNALVKAGNANGIIRHTENRITENKWYIAVPTLLPYTNAQKNDLEGTLSDLYINGQDDPFSNNKNNKTNFFWQLIINGLDASKYDSSFNLGLTGTITTQSIVDKISEMGFATYENIKNEGWTSALNYFNTELKAK